MLNTSRVTPYLTKNLIKYNEFCSANNEGNVVLPTKARVVVCGGGVLGSSVAYHLGELGWGEHTVVLEKGRLV